MGMKNEPQKVAVFAGSFDPFTLGHLDIVKRASKLFDTLWILVAENASKNCLFDSLTRANLVKEAVAEFANVNVAVHEGLTVDFMKSVEASYLVRGVRGSMDVDYEQSVAWNNKTLYEKAETVILLSAPEHLSISSSVVRELLKCGRGAKNLNVTIQKFIPSNILSKLLTEYEKI